jgi:hypothetical protein
MPAMCDESALAVFAAMLDSAGLRDRNAVAT